ATSPSKVTPARQGEGSVEPMSPLGRYCEGGMNSNGENLKTNCETYARAVKPTPPWAKRSRYSSVAKRSNRVVEASPPGLPGPIAACRCTMPRGKVPGACMMPSIHIQDIVSGPYDALPSALNSQLRRMSLVIGGP